MTPFERWEDLEAAIRAALAGNNASIWTHLPVKISSVAADGQTVTVQPLIQGQQRQEDGSFVNVTLPLVPDVPVKFLGGGGFVLTHPLAAGDEGTIACCTHPIDNWYGSGGIQPPSDGRRHSLADSFFMPGGNSVPNKIANVSQDTVQLRSRDGTSYIEMAANGVFNVKGTMLNLLGDCALAVGGDVVAGASGGAGTSVSLLSHTTSEVTAGAAVSGPPVPGT